MSVVLNHFASETQSRRAGVITQKRSRHLDPEVVKIASFAMKGAQFLGLPCMVAHF
jgi:hypothetical protein